MKDRRISAREGRGTLWTRTQSPGPTAWTLSWTSTLELAGGLLTVLKWYNYSMIEAVNTIWAGARHKMTCPANTQIRLSICPVWSVFAARMKTPKSWLFATHKAPSEDWSDWASESSRGRTCDFVGLVMLRFGDCSVWYYWYMRTAKTLIRLGGCPGWSESSLGAQRHCWFCHEAARICKTKCEENKTYRNNNISKLIYTRNRLYIVSSG